MATDNLITGPDRQPDQPSWKELTEFIKQQAENDRGVIDYWFKFASWLIGIVLVIAGAAIGFVGWKTISDAKASAEAVARDAAKAKVEEVLKQPDVQKLVRDTASELFAKGVFRKEIERKVSELISAEVNSEGFHKLVSEAVKGELIIKTAPRALTQAQIKTIAGSLRSNPEGKVSIRTGALPEQQGYARQLLLAIEAAPSWKGHVSYLEPGTLMGMTNDRNLLLDGNVVVVNDVRTAPESARALETALKNAGIAGVRLGTCNCSDPPKPPDIWLYVGEKNY